VVPVARVFYKKNVVLIFLIRLVCVSSIKDYLYLVARTYTGMLFPLRILLILIFCINTVAVAQQDSTKTKHTSVTKKAFKKGLGYITTGKRDTVKNESSVDINKVYSGRIIRNIDVEHIGFERSIYDSSKRTNKFMADAANFFHTNTKKRIIRQHLLFKENTPLNPYKLSDNERYIRDLDFILDCRIVVSPVDDQSDSVDVTVITRDVFSLGATVGGTIPTAPKIGIYDANVAGLAQRIEFTGLIDATRSPVFSFATSFKKSSLFGSLVNLDIGYTQLNTGRSYGVETEYAYYIRGSRPLVSPYSRIAGGFEFSQNWSVNVKQKDDSLFKDYRYKVADFWLGCNFGIKKDFSNRNRIFLAGRFFNGTYLDQPEQPEYKANVKYNDYSGSLAELTFYRQDFYRTRYVFGFGRTEDVPYGMSIAFSAGYIHQLVYQRPYTAIKYHYRLANRKGNFFSIGIEAGGYADNEKLQDAVINTTSSYFTRAVNLGTYKMRTLATVGYARMINQTVLPSIEIDDSEMIGFSADSIWGNQKSYLRLETTLYTPWNFFGFRFAPFLGGGLSSLDCQTCEDNRILFYGISGGIRTRNENLIFGTMEVRLTFIPATDYTKSQFSFDFRQRLRVKNSSSFIRPPSLIKY